MNIFVTSECPAASAQYLDDKRVIKMILESAQILSTVIHQRGGVGPYKPTHQNHPCTVWAGENQGNYLWLYAHFVSLCNQYYIRYMSIHKCSQYSRLFRESIELLPEGELTEFVNCTTYKEMPTFEAYEKYLEDKWAIDKRKPTWYREVR